MRQNLFEMERGKKTFLCAHHHHKERRVYIIILFLTAFFYSQKLSKFTINLVVIINIIMLSGLH